jgi:hypothetical protein
MSLITEANLSLIIQKTPPHNRSTQKRRQNTKTILRRLELVKIWNSPYCQLLNYSHLAKILKVSDQTINRDCEFLSKYKLLMPLRENEIPYVVKETAQQYIARFLLAHGVEL